MRHVASILIVSLCLGCTSKIDTGGAGLDVPVYPGAKITSSGENQGIIGANFETADPSRKVVSYYENQLGAKEEAGAIKGSKGGHQITVIVTDVGGKTSGVITETK